MAASTEGRLRLAAMSQRTVLRMHVESAQIDCRSDSPNHLGRGLRYEVSL